MSYNILIVDDDPEIQSCIKLSLDDLDASLETAFNGEEALQFIKEQKPDVIISDVMMPQMNGFVLCDKIKNSREYKSIPSILLTSRDDESNKYYDDFTDPDIYMKKPFDSKELLENVKKLLEGKDTKA